MLPTFCPRPDATPDEQQAFPEDGLVLFFAAQAFGNVNAPTPMFENVNDTTANRHVSVKGSNMLRYALKRAQSCSLARAFCFDRGAL